ncbi:MAG: hypothetical protein GEU80_13480 [Dehalococcoidia bacterium]|nr:hypothetical protein [Dehalococcoidia bacterium]
MTDPLPQPPQQAITEFVRLGRTGRIELRFRDGRVTGYEVTTAHRPGERPDVRARGRLPGVRE